MARNKRRKPRRRTSRKEREVREKVEQEMELDQQVACSTLEYLGFSKRDAETLTEIEYTEPKYKIRIPLNRVLKKVDSSFPDVISELENAIKQYNQWHQAAIKNPAMQRVMCKRWDSETIEKAIAAIFIPLTFVTGLYGMNFKYMPELGWRWGYFVVLGFMLTVGVILLYYFRRKKWL